MPSAALGVPSCDRQGAASTCEPDPALRSALAAQRTQQPGAQIRGRLRIAVDDVSAAASSLRAQSDRVKDSGEGPRARPSYAMKLRRCKALSIAPGHVLHPRRRRTSSGAEKSAELILAKAVHHR